MRDWTEQDQSRFRFDFGASVTTTFWVAAALPTETVEG